MVIEEAIHKIRSSHLISDGTTFAEALLAVLAEVERLDEENDRLHARLAACGIRPTGPDQCAHGIDDGEYCPPCNAAYKRARAENEPDGDPLCEVCGEALDSCACDDADTGRN